MSLNTADLSEFYSDFDGEAVINGLPEPGIFSREELETDSGYGVYPVYRCATPHEPGQIATIDSVDYEIKATKPLEFGEYLLILSDDS